jgi:hypothetical protein
MDCNQFSTTEHPGLAVLKILFLAMVDVMSGTILHFCCNVVTLDAERLLDDLAARSPSSQLIACAGRLVSVRLTDF